MQPETTERLSVTDVRHFTQEYKLGLIQTLQMLVQTLTISAHLASSRSISYRFQKQIPGTEVIIYLVLLTNSRQRFVGGVFSLSILCSTLRL